MYILYCILLYIMIFLGHILLLFVIGWHLSKHMLVSTYNDTDRLILRDMRVELIFPTKDETFQSCTSIFKRSFPVPFLSMCANCQPFSYSFFQDISGLGLRHVGYAIPAELFAPFVGSAVEVFSAVTSNETAISGFTWAMQLVSKTLGCALGQF